MHAPTRLLTLVALLATTACAKPGPSEPPKGDEPSTGSAGTTQLANPASVHCEQEGGKLEIVDTPEGQQGICTLKDGTRCEEWAYMRGECPAAAAAAAPAE